MTRRRSIFARLTRRDAEGERSRVLATTFLTHRNATAADVSHLPALRPAVQAPATGKSNGREFRNERRIRL
jgi:hypothetical protein